MLQLDDKSGLILVEKAKDRTKMSRDFRLKPLNHQWMMHKSNTVYVFPSWQQHLSFCTNNKTKLLCCSFNNSGLHIMWLRKGEKQK